MELGNDSHAFDPAVTTLTDSVWRVQHEGETTWGGANTLPGPTDVALSLQALSAADIEAALKDVGSLTAGSRRIYLSQRMPDWLDEIREESARLPFCRVTIAGAR